MDQKALKGHLLTHVAPLALDSQVFFCNNFSNTSSIIV